MQPGDAEYTFTLEQEYIERPAISRVDVVTPICPDCGTRQALESIGVSVEEQNKILQAIHKSMK